jgi:phospholipid transport system substrate-binding protein
MSYQTTHAVALSRPVALLRRVCVGLTLVVLVVVTLTRPHAALATDPASIVNELLANALGMLGDKNLSESNRAEKFRVLLEQDFDMPRIAHFVLGSYWDSASDAERQTFTHLFEQWIVAAYSQGFNTYDGEGIKVIGSRIAGENTVIVTSEIVDRAGGSGTKVDWVLRREDQSFKIVNINVEGVSLVVTEREQIQAVIAHSGGTVSGANDALLEKLASAN